MLKEMVDKGLKSVLVLDCCCSGAVLRDSQHNDDQHPREGKIREAVYNAEIDRQSSRVDLPREKLPNMFKAPTRRGATATPFSRRVGPVKCHANWNLKIRAEADRCRIFCSSH